jgi:hypothetical protein
VFYYLDNFRTALRCLLQRYSDLLSAAEWQFIEDFERLPRASQALLVRLIMRKGELFRESKIVYAEIGGIAEAAVALSDLQWLDPNPALTVDELFGLLTRAELAAIFNGLSRGISKRDALEILRPLYAEPRTLENWIGHCTEAPAAGSTREPCRPSRSDPVLATRATLPNDRGQRTRRPAPG